MYWILLITVLLPCCWLISSLYKARMKFQELEKMGIPIMTHSFIFGHLPVVKQFYQDWATDANLIQSFGLYISLYWRKFFPNESQCPPVIYLDVWPIAIPMAFSMVASVSNQIEIGKSLPKSPMQGEFLRPISNGRDLNCMHGEEWRVWRSRFNPGFSKTNIRQWIPALLEEAEAFAEALNRLAGKDGNWGEVFKLETISGNLAFDTTGRVVINSRFLSQSANPSRFTVLFRKQLERMEITLDPRKLIWRATPMFRRTVDKTRTELFEFLKPFIEEGLQAGDSERLTIIEAAVRECRIETMTTKFGSIADESFVEQVFCQLMIFFFGGDDAVSITIPWMIKHLQNNPECIDKLRDEHNQVFGKNPQMAASKIRESPHILDSLQYTHAVIKETLRLNPATITIRQGQPDFNMEIPGSNVRWPTAGFDLFDSSITIHRDAANFPKPLEFIPERFLVNEGHPLYPPRNTWRGFQLGPRKCIGQEMAIVVLKLALVVTMRSFDIELAFEEWDKLQELKHGYKVERRLVEGEKMYTTGKATAHPKDGAPAQVRLRQLSEI